jgi:uncharacterized membrane protein
MYLEFARPWAFILLPVAAVFIIWFARNLRSKSASRRIGMTILRCLVLTLVILAMSGPSIQKNSDRTTTIFVVDLSDSTGSVQESEAEFVRQAITDMGVNDQAGIVVFGSDARIEQFVSDKKVFTAFQSEVQTGGTNLEQAVQTALALFPEGSARRLVLLTDGAENEGEILDTAGVFSGTDVEFKVVSYDSSVESEVYVSNVTLPDTIRQGDTFQVQVEIYATQSTNATVSLYSGRTLKGQKETVLQKGYNQLLFSDEGVEGGLKSYRVTVEADADTVSVNNSYSAFTTVESRAKVLLVEGESGMGSAFTRILDACNYDYDVVTPSGVPGQIADMTQYQSIILLDVYADDLRDGFLDILDTYVKDYAGGLIAIGGSNSYALGNYKNTPLETVLPVSMDLEGEKQIPKIAMAMVIDHSGSMSSASTDKSSITCMDIAKQAAVNALDSLREIDEVGVLAFDDTYTWAVPMQTATDISGITSRISGIQANGGTSIYPALAEAVSALEDSDATLKHIILLTDGQDGYHGYDDVLQEMADNGITLSTVAVGTGADSQTLKWLAEEGQGRYYYSDAGTSLPRIFAQEVYLSTKSYLINEEFVPTIVNSHEILNGVFDDGSPSLLGYIATTPKSAATVLLESDREDPILAVWQYGLGRSVAWTSDGTNEWTGNFAGWDNYAELWRNIIDWTISESDLGEDVMSVSQEGNSIILDYEAQEYTTDTEITAVLTDEDGNRQDVTLKAVSPGNYLAEIDMEETGVYSINVRRQDDGEIVKNVNTAAALQYSREYRYAEIDGNLDSFVEQVDGRYITEPNEVFDTDLQGAVSRTDMTQALLVLAILLFVLDIVMRRLHIDWLALGTNAVHRCMQKIKNTTKAKSSAAKKQTSESMRKMEHTKTASKEETNTQQESVDANFSSEHATKQPKSAFKHEPESTVSGENGKKPKSTSSSRKKKVDAKSDVIDTATLLKKKQERDL